MNNQQMNGHSLLLYTASHLFDKSVLCRSFKLTTGDFECMVCLKQFTLKKWQFLISSKKKSTRAMPQCALVWLHPCPCTIGFPVILVYMFSIKISWRTPKSCWYSSLVYAALGGWYTNSMTVALLFTSWSCPSTV